MRALRCFRSGLLAVALLAGCAALSSCGDSSKKKAPASGGSAGDASSGGSNAAGSSGEAGESGSSGSSGSGGDAGSGGSSGAGGSSSPVASFGMLFSVAAEAAGVPQTGVAAAGPNAQSNLYRSSGSGAAHVQGTNAVGYTAADLGIDPTDDVDAVSVIHPAVASAFFFSVVDQPAHDEGIDGSAVRLASTEAEVQSDIFLTFGLAPLGGNGSNLAWVDEFRLGLLPEALGGASTDNLNALDVDVPAAAQPLLFSVNAAALGAPSSGVAGVAAAERGCTIFSSNLDGTNQVLWTCANLGLEPGDELDALVVLGVGAEARSALFSVTPESVGAAGSAVSTQGAEAAADIFASGGMGQNQLYVEERALGLLADDDLDALAIRSAGSPGDLLPIPVPLDEPPLVDPPACPFPPAVFVLNPNANLPQYNSNAAITTRVADPQGKITRSAANARFIEQVYADTLNRSFPCNTRRGVAPPPGVNDPVVEVLCPPGATDFVPDNLMIGVIEREQPLDETLWEVIQGALVVDTNGNPADNYVAGEPYTKDPFDNTDEVVQAQRPPGGTLQANAQTIAGNVFQPISGVPNRVVRFGRHWVFFMRVAAASFPYRLMFFASDAQYGQTGGPWTMSTVAPVGEPMMVAPFVSCP